MDRLLEACGVLWSSDPLIQVLDVAFFAAILLCVIRRPGNVAFACSVVVAGWFCAKLLPLWLYAVIMLGMAFTLTQNETRIALALAYIYTARVFIMALSGAGLIPVWLAIELSIIGFAVIVVSLFIGGIFGGGKRSRYRFRPRQSMDVRSFVAGFQRKHADE